MLGKTNASQADAKLSPNSTVCYYRAAYAVSTPSAVIAGYQKDYLSYSAPTFTVLKQFTATVAICGKGVRNQNGNSRPITYNFKKNGSTLYSGSFGYSGEDVSHSSVMFSRGDTFSISGSKESDSTTNYGDLSFCLKFEE